MTEEGPDNEQPTLPEGAVPSMVAYLQKLNPGCRISVWRGVGDEMLYKAIPLPSEPQPPPEPSQGEGKKGPIYIQRE
ncbi:hypothetical protein JW766_06195 [Candidatus Dojkabacteria bacterium]|nr:hypothetical protein [Candidatus Dojkabacteria bacterium]